MFKILAIIVAIVSAGTAVAQPVAFKAGGDLLPLSHQFDSSRAYFEILGKGPGGDFAEYYSLDTAPGAPHGAAADYAASVMASAVNGYTKAAARFSYDRSVAPSAVPLPGAATYPGLSFEISMSNAAGQSGRVRVDTPDINVRDRGSLQGLGVIGRGVGYPPAALPQGDSLTVTDTAPAAFEVDLREMMASSGCCSQLHLSAPGPLLVNLQAPTAYRPVYMSLELYAARDRTLPAGSASLPGSLDLASFDVVRSMTVIFGGHFGVSVDASDYTSHADYLAARSWIDANLSLVNVEFAVDYELTSLQPVPEPATAWFLAGGLLCLALWRRRPPAG